MKLFFNYKLFRTEEEAPGKPGLGLEKTAS